MTVGVPNSFYPLFTSYENENEVKIVASSRRVLAKGTSEQLVGINFANSLNFKLCPASDSSDMLPSSLRIQDVHI